MKVWLCKHSEEIPVEEHSRKYRVGMLADQLVKNDHEVIWWASNFNHSTKEKKMLPEKLYNGVNMKIANVIKYEKNLSISRIFNHYQIGNYFTKYSKKESDFPDLIYVSMPTLDFAYRATKFATKNNIPIVIDIRDLWPDVFMDLLPAKLRKDIFFLFWNKKLKFILKNATSIIGITEEYLFWGLSKAQIDYDNMKHKVFPLGYEKVEISSNKPDKFTVTFAGTVGYHFDIDTICKAAEKLIDKEVYFQILGDGDLLEKLKEKYGGLSNIEFSGHLNGLELKNKLNNSSIGIAPYHNSKNFLLNIPNKPFEYMAYGLPILTTLAGPTQKLVENNNIGYKYHEYDEDDLVDKILILKNNQEIYSLMKDNCSFIFQQNFEKNKVYNEMVNYFENIIDFSS